MWNKTNTSSGDEIALHFVREALVKSYKNGWSKSLENFNHTIKSQEKPYANKHK